MKPLGAYIGLMSGTSLDGVDGAMVEFFTGTQGQMQSRTLACASADIPRTLREDLRLLATGAYLNPVRSDKPLPDALELAALAANRLSDLYLEVVGRLRSAAPNIKIEAIGAHGQTIRHRPELGLTVQLLNGARLAALGAIPVCCDFRSADVALSGQGAPLVPLFHQEILSSPKEPRIILNLGGIANISLLSGHATLGFDTGPASTLLDAWYLRHHAAESPSPGFDAEGAWAASGTSQQALLDYMLEEPFFSMDAPKSTGRELFSTAWLDAKLAQFLEHRSGRLVPEGHATGTEALSPADVQATLSQLTAQSIAQATSRAIKSRDHWNHQTAKVFACGGGVRNTQLMLDIRAAYQEQLGSHITLETTESLGIDPQQVEASAFAWLALKRWHQIPLDYRQITGSTRPHVMGAVYLP